MTNELILIEKFASIASLTLNRPEKRNALNGALIKAFLQALKKLSADTKTRVLIIHGNGENFCAGGDVSWMKEVTASSENDNYADANMLADLMYQLYYFPKPTIVLAHGVTLGGGLGLLSACDIVIASNNASFGFSEVKIGMTPSTISPYVIAAIGERAARYYFLTGDRFDVAEAQRIGLVHQIIEEDALLSRGASVAKRLLLNGPNAMIETKSLIRQVANEKITIDLANKTAKLLAKVRASAEGQEGLSAFIEKRNPKWE